MDYLWLFAVAGGPIILAGALIWALLRQRRLTPREQQRGDEATKRLYDEE
jgi:hypothetical protein